MIGSYLMFGLFLLVPLAQTNHSEPQALVKPPGGDRPYTLTVPVDEVSLTFHASDFQGTPIEDLTLSDLRLEDHGTRQRRITVVRGVPESSNSRRNSVRYEQVDAVSVKRNREIAGLYATHLLRKQTDKAFEMRFDFETQMRQGWTNDSASLASSLQAIASGYTSRLGGTALFNAVYSACHDQWTSDPAADDRQFHPALH